MGNKQQCSRSLTGWYKINETGLHANTAGH